MSYNHSGSGGRRPSMYPDISHLNALPTEYDMQIPHAQPHGNLEIDTDLSLFTDGEFFNFDMGEMSGPHLQYPHHGMSQPTSAAQSAYPGGDYQDFSMVASTHSLPGHGNMKPYSPAAADYSAANSPRTGEKRKPTSGSSPDAKGSPVEESSDLVRVAAEEDKRRRNTAASARFRVKKKQREQAMEKTAKDMTDRVTFLENRVGQLESENKILRDLLTDKVGKDVNVAKVLADSPAHAESSKSDQRKQESA